MTPLEVLAALVTFAVGEAPAIAKDVEALVEAFKRTHPELVAAPPPDGEAAVDAAVDAEIKASAR